MKPFNTIIATTEFEFRRGFTFRRMLVSLILILFPPSMLFLILISSGGGGPDINLPICVLIYIIGALSLLLWATPNVYAELESKGWMFLSTRSKGRIGLLIGKYIAAITNAWVNCFVAMFLCVLVAESFGIAEQPILVVLSGYTGLITLACVSYGAMFSLIGVMFQKRAMVVAAVYTLISELVLASVPALVSRFTIRFYLQGLAIHWLNLDLPIRQRQQDIFLELFIGRMPDALRVGWVLVITFLALSCASFAIRYRQYITADET